MGTKLQGNAFLLDYAENLKNEESPLYDREKVRRTILEHESIFKNQLQELHRLYGRQRELMNEIRSREMKEDKCWLFSRNLLEDARKPRDPYHSSSSRPMAGYRSSKLPVFSNHQGSSYGINGVQISQHKADALTFDFKKKDIISTNLCTNFDLATKDFFPSPSILGLRNERHGKEQPSDDYAVSRRFDGLSSGKPPAFPQSLLAGPKKDFSNTPLDMGASVSRKRKKIFGVEICEENDDQKDENPRVLSSSWIDNSFMQSLHLRGANPSERSKGDTKCELTSSKEIFSNNSDSQIRKKDSQQSQGGLPWFLRNSQVCGDQSKEKEGSWYFMNIDSLQNSSQKFFGKAGRPENTFQTSNQNMNEVNDGTSAKINGMSDLRHCIDLNLSLDEEDAVSPPYIPAAIVKMATTEIDSEASTVIESPKRDESKNMELECEKFAAEAMMAIAASSPESGPVDSLKWFAEVVSGESLTIPDGMDYFEYTTLKLEDTEKEGYHYEPLVSNIASDDETGGTQTRRCRRRGGRQRKDFQRDILPGLVTLSRLQVTEDFQAFDELLKAGGSGQRRNGRGRRRPGGANTSPTVKKLCSTEAEQPICRLEERSALAGWGKRTRRLPRQRCSNAFLSFPVKC